MTTGEDTLQVLRTEVSKLKLRLKELIEENRDLRGICNDSGIHYEEQLAGIDTVWVGSDINKDGYISFPEYERFVQEAHWLAHQEAAAKKLLGEDMHLFDENWREEL